MNIRVATVRLAFTRMSPVLRHPSVHRRRQSNTAALPCVDWTKNSSFFNYERVRFLSDEQAELAARCAKFDMNALSDVAVKAAGAESCIDIVKCAEGLSNKVFMMTMNNGSRVIAKVPNVGTGRPHFTTASEVATMEFARKILSTPVPRVLDWSSRALENTVGAEYIIMEPVTGVPLAQAWRSMGFKQKTAAIVSLWRIQKAWSSASFTRYGSLYFSKDVDVDNSLPLYYDVGGAPVTNTLYAVGSTNAEDSFEDDRAKIQFDRGPWPSAKAYYIAIANREAKCIKDLKSLPRSLIALSGPNLYIPTRKRKLEAIDAALKIIDNVLPSNPLHAAATLWHQDFHGDNIFVDEKDPTQVTGVIDWQFVEIAPLFEFVRRPYFLDYDGEEPDDPLTPPTLPDHFDQLPPDEKKRAGGLYDAEVLVCYYRRLVQKTSEKVHTCYEYCATDQRDVLTFLRAVLEIGEEVILSKVAAIVTDKKKWSQGSRTEGATDEPPPITFTADAVAHISQRLEDSLEGVEEMNAIKARLGVKFMRKSAPVDPERYEDIMSLLEEVKEEFIAKHAKTDAERLAWEEAWPFDKR